ncbi:type II toxin-antitoxin system RelE/ParE family toxin [Phenylobacterium sp.]|uniref:type II toxin-antitoxin system RelE/ParE family toxin n=1 Tax=Phenylobacterium sp. TaxID=1871053 RepID=UPI003983B5AE
MNDAGQSPFADWFEDLDPVAAAKVTVAVARIACGATSNLKGVGDGLMEYRINYGPGYRVYLGWSGRRLVILLGGGTKRRQAKDIEAAKARWTGYKTRAGRRS